MSIKSMIIGACIGAGVALLYAPATGRATRAKIRDKAVGVGHDVTDYVESKKQHLTNKLEGYKSKAKKATGRLHDMMDSRSEQQDFAMTGEPTI